jgi:PRC-barrel domain
MARFVYNDANEKIGDINDVILDKAGKVENVILGVGGFLGMGEHYVAVAYDKLKWSNEPPRSTTASTVHREPSGDECRQQRSHCRRRYRSHDRRSDDGGRSEGQRILVSRPRHLQRVQGPVEGNAAVQILSRNLPPRNVRFEAVDFTPTNPIRGLYWSVVINGVVAVSGHRGHDVESGRKSLGARRYRQLGRWRNRPPAWQAGGRALQVRSSLARGRPMCEFNSNIDRDNSGVAGNAPYPGALCGKPMKSVLTRPISSGPGHLYELRGRPLKNSPSGGGKLVRPPCK